MAFAELHMSGLIQAYDPSTTWKVNRWKSDIALTGLDLPVGGASFLAVKGDGSMAANARKGSTGLWVLGAALLVVAGLWWFGPKGPGGSVDVNLPKLSRPAQAGQKAFVENCAACHGDLAGGTDQGPPLVPILFI